MSGKQKEKLSRLPTQNQQAYQLYVKGRYFLDRWEAADRAKAFRYFQQAIASVPSYAAAYAGLAEVHAEQAFFGEGQEKRALGLAAAKRG